MAHMTTMRRIRNFISHTHFSRDWRYWEPFYPTTRTEKQMPALPPDVQVTYRPFRANTKWQKGIDGRLEILAFRMTQLLMMERVEMLKPQAIDLRPYVERLIVEALKHGDRHRPTMELADFWLREKQAVHKLFKVIVPRFSNSCSSFTSLFFLPPRYEWNSAEAVAKRDWATKTWNHRERAVLEIKGNPYPPLLPARPSSRTTLTNVLMSGARLEYERDMNQRQQQQSAATV